MEFQEFKDRVTTVLKLDLNSYKETQLKRRIDAMMIRRKISTYQAYLELLSRDREAVRDFVDYMTINVTEFFRDIRAFEELERKVLPELLAANPRLKIWSAACSNGAEPYSVAMILEELTAGRIHRLEATDLDPNVLQIAAQGVYPADLLRNVSAARRQRYFQADKDRYALDAQIKKRVAFRRHNLLADPYGADYDLIICRNVQIYFTKEAQWRVNSQFAKALRPGGVLFLGATETIFKFNELGFERFALSFYRKTPKKAEK